MAAAATVRWNGRLTIPSAIRQAVHLGEGDIVEFEVVEDGLFLRRRENDDIGDPPYHGTPEWEAGIEEALANVAAGNAIHLGSDEEFLETLESWSKHAKRDREA